MNAAYVPHLVMLYIQEESTRRKEALRLETETGVRRRRMELERELDTERLEARFSPDLD